MSEQLLKYIPVVACVESKRWLRELKTNNIDIAWKKIPRTRWVGWVISVRGELADRKKIKVDKEEAFWYLRTALELRTIVSGPELSQEFIKALNTLDSGNKINKPNLTRLCSMAVKNFNSGRYNLCLYYAACSIDYSSICFNDAEERRFFRVVFDNLPWCPVMKGDKDETE